MVALSRRYQQGNPSPEPANRSLRQLPVHPRGGQTVLRSAPPANQPGVWDAAQPRSSEPRSVWLPYLYLLWFVIVWDPHRLLGWYGPDIFHRTAALLFAPIVVTMTIRAPLLGRREVLLPFLVYVAIAALGVPLARNRGLAFETFQTLLLYYLLAVATLVYVRTPRQAMPIVMIVFWQYAWWGMFARGSGAVAWHPNLANFDGFGGLMVSGVGFCYWIAVGAERGWLKRVAYMLALYCLVGAIASFARGAIFATIAIAGYIWLRSPRKVLTGAAILAGGVVFLAASAVLFPGGALWPELQSTFTQGTTAGTGRDRWELWKAAYQVFLERPLIGVGGGNFGVFAASFFGEGEVGGYENPATLWGRNLHSFYFQILSEFGVAGVLTFTWLMVGFFRKVHALQQESRRLAWRTGTASRIKLHYLAYAVEASMLGNLLGGIFYASLYMPWTYTTLALGAMLFHVTRPAPPASQLRAGAASRRLRR